MNVKQFVWGLLLCLFPIMVCAEKTSGLAWDAILYDQPNTSSVKLQKLYAGDVVVILEPERPDFWVKVQTRNGNTGYVDSGALDFPSGMEGSSSEGLVHMQLYTPRDGIYRVVAEDAVFFYGEPGYGGREPGVLPQDTILKNVVYRSKEWCTFKLPDGSEAYVKKRFLHKMRLYEVADEFGVDSPEYASEKALTEKVPGNTVFNGFKSGRYGVWLVIITAGVLIVVSLIRKLRTNIKLYGGLLCLMSLLELWYLLSLGALDAGWFLMVTSDVGWLNVFLMAGVTVVQIWCLLQYAVDIQETFVFNFSWKSMLFGVFLALLLCAFIILPVSLDSTASLEGVEPLVVVIAFLCQIPHLLMVLYAFFRRAKNRSWGFFLGQLLVYWVAVSGAVVACSISLALLLFMILCAIGFLLLARYAPEYMLKEGLFTLDRMSYQNDIDGLDNLVKSGRMSASDAAAMKDKLLHNMNNFIPHRKGGLK